MSSNYNRRQNSVRRWDQVLRNLRRDIAILKTLILRNTRGNLIAGNRGVVTNDASSVSAFGLNNFYGAKIYLNDQLYFDEESEGDILNPADWIIDYNTVPVSLLYANNYHFQVPEELNGESILGKNVFLEVTINFTLQIITDYSNFNRQSGFELSVTRNDEEEYLMFIGNHTDFINDRNDVEFLYRTFNTSDILKLSPNDKLTIYLHKNDNISKISVEGGEKSVTYASFRIIGLEDAI